jgi:hypothetical protein
LWRSAARWPEFLPCRRGLAFDTWSIAVKAAVARFWRCTRADTVRGGVYHQCSHLNFVVNLCGARVLRGSRQFWLHWGQQVVLQLYELPKAVQMTHTRHLWRSCRRGWERTGGKQRSNGRVKREGST